MPKLTTRYVCSNCGAESITWSGRCHICGEWNTLEEEIAPQANVSKPQQGSVLKTKAVKTALSSAEPRLQLKLGDTDRALGSGLVRGSVILLAGEPGIGKSTLLLQIADAVSKSKAPVLYVSGEESEHQVGYRAKRLGATGANIQLVSATNAEDIAASILSGAFKVAVVDSIQTIATSRLSSSAGSVGQITSSAHFLIQAAKTSNTCLILVGHVTKEGAIAGPKILEHIVDVVLQLEGDRYGGFKVLRSVKNRYGSTNEVAIFEMNETGLEPVDNPSKAMLAERQAVDGSVVLATMEGSRPVLVEVQALVNTTNYGYAKRTASGFDLNRLNVLVAMLERRTKLKLGDKDIFINIVGGLKISEPAADLAICMAIGSAAKGMQLKSNAVVFGEVGLSGEVRHVRNIEKRCEEANKLGFDVAIGPKIQRGKKINYLKSVRDVKTALNAFLEV